MFKKIKQQLALFCMKCSSELPSISAECPCNKQPRKKERTFIPVVQVPEDFNELTH